LGPLNYLTPSQPMLKEYREEREGASEESGERGGSKKDKDRTTRKKNQTSGRI